MRDFVFCLNFQRPLAIMSMIYVEGQFSDAEEDTSAVLDIKPVILEQSLDPKALDNFHYQYDDDYEDEDYDYSDDDYDDWNDHSVDGKDKMTVVSLGGKHPNRQLSSQTNVKTFQPSEKVFKKFSDKINVDKYEGPKLCKSAINKVFEQEKRVEKER